MSEHLVELERETPWLNIGIHPVCIVECAHVLKKEEGNSLLSLIFGKENPLHEWLFLY